MKKALSFLLLIALLLTAALAEAPAVSEEIPGAVDMPAMGLAFTPPESFRNLKGTLLTEGTMPIDDYTFVAYWVYLPMSRDEVSRRIANADSDPDFLYSEVFDVFALSGGRDFNTFNALYGSPIKPEKVREIGRAGDTIYYLYTAGMDEAFTESLDPVFRDEYTAIASQPDVMVSGLSFYEPAGRAGSVVAFETTDLDGNPVSSADLFAENRITMVNVWATWCQPCLGELSELQQIHTRIRAKDCGIVGLLVDNNLDAARRLIRENGITYPVVLAPSNLNDILPVTGYPTTFFITKDGVIAADPIVGAYVDRYEPALDAIR